MTIFKVGDTVQFWTYEECYQYTKTVSPSTGLNWGDVGWVEEIVHENRDSPNYSQLLRVEFEDKRWNRNIGAGALKLVKSYEDLLKERLGDDYV